MTAEQLADLRVRLIGVCRRTEQEVIHLAGIGQNGGVLSTTEPVVRRTLYGQATTILVLCTALDALLAHAITHEDNQQETP